MPVRVAVVGKGGAGKSVLAGTLARVLARSGEPVLALDSDLQPGLELSRGVRPPRPPALMEAAVRGDDRRWRLAPGVGPVRAVQRYAVAAPDGVRLLQCGKASGEGVPAIQPAIQAYWRVIHGIGTARSLSRWHFVGDLPAGPRQVGFGWVPFADRLLVVAEPSSMSLLAARRTIRVAAETTAAAVEVVAAKVRGREDARHIADFLGLEPIATVPWDAGVAEAERAGVAPIDHAPEGPAVAEITRLAAVLRTAR
jgi:CO dehydrogenase maturation factor